MAQYNEEVTVQTDSTTAVFGASNRWVGVLGVTENATTNGNPAGVYGLARNAHGVIGETTNGDGVLGITGSPNGALVHSGQAGVYGLAGQGVGVIGVSQTYIGVYGESQGTPESGSAGVYGVGKTDNIGVRGECPGGIGVLGTGKVAGAFEGLVQAMNDMEVWGKLDVGGNVTVKGDVMLTNGDGAEEFEIAGAEAVDPGTVMVLTGGGALLPSQQAYDKRVAGIVSGAGDYRPAMVLDRREGAGNRQPIALFGKVCCKVDAQYGPVEIGDLLTTSPTPGHAMKAADPLKSFGSVIGKALGPLEGGQGLVPVLVSLQ
jgi:hypothetical protein